MIGAGRSWRGLPAFCLITGKMVSLTSVCIKSYSDVILTHEFFVSRFESAAREAGGAFKSRLTEPAEGGCSGAENSHLNNLSLVNIFKSIIA